jgi:hypothetical protein
MAKDPLATNTAMTAMLTTPSQVMDFSFMVCVVILVP